MTASQAQHGARRTRHSRQPRRRPPRTDASRPGLVPHRPGEGLPLGPDPTRKRSRFLHSWHRGGRRAHSCRGPAGAGAGTAAGPPLAGSAPRPGGLPLHPGSRTRAGPCLRRPGAGAQKSRRVGVDARPRSPAPRERLTPCRWKPSEVSAGCSVLEPRPMAAARPGAGVPERSADPVPPAPTRPLGAQLPAPSHVDASPRPPPILTLLATGRQLRLQGRARRGRPAVRGVPWTPIPASGPAPPRQARTPSRWRPEMNSNDSSLMVRGPGAAGRSLWDSPPLVRSPPRHPSQPCRSPAPSGPAPAVPLTRTLLSSAAAGS